MIVRGRWQFESEAGHFVKKTVLLQGERKRESLESLAIPSTPATSVDPCGAHPIRTSIQKNSGEVSRQQVACHFLSLPSAIRRSE